MEVYVRQSSMKVSQDKEFIASNRWKCEKSQTGAHYWVIQCYQMTCKYCHHIKQVSDTGSDSKIPDKSE